MASLAFPDDVLLTGKVAVDIVCSRLGCSAEAAEEFISQNVNSPVWDLPLDFGGGVSEHHLWGVLGCTTKAKSAGMVTSRKGKGGSPPIHDWPRIKALYEEMVELGEASAVFDACMRGLAGKAERAGLTWPKRSQLRRVLSPRHEEHKAAGRLRPVHKPYSGSGI